MWAAQYFHFTRPRRWIQSGGLGTMGFGMPAAMGAAVAQPDLLTVVLSGDASIQMNIQELATLATYGIPVKVVIMNNGFLGMVRQWQELFWDRRYSHVEMSQWPDFVKLAEAMGCHGVRLEDKTTLVEDLRAAFAVEGPVVIDARVTREESVYPMIAPGQAAREHGGLSAWASPEPRSCSASRTWRPRPVCAPAASTCCRSWWRTSPAS